LSRFIESDDEPYANAWALWARAQRNALVGKKGQAVLRELETALVALPTKRLIHGALCEQGEVCALGALARQRGVSEEEMATQRGEYAHDIAWWAKDRLGVTEALATAVQWQNDEAEWYWQKQGETPEERYIRVLAWVRAQIKSEVGA
jgi:hypothetical protein